MKFKTLYNGPHPTKGWTSEKESQTVPDQTMSVREIMSRYVRGLPISGQRVPVYNGEEYVPDVRKMDLVDIQEAKEATQRRIAEMQEDLRKQDEKRKKKPAPAPKAQEEPKTTPTELEA